MRLGRSQPIRFSKSPVRFGKPRFFPPFFLEISGVVTLSGSPQTGVSVYLIDQTSTTLVGSKTTNGSGAYSYTSGDNLVASHQYLASVAYDSGANKYNAPDLPYLTPLTHPV